MSIGPSPKGAAISSAETYWLESPPSISTRPEPKCPRPSIITGGQPVGALATMPSDLRAVTSGPIGRLRIASSPSTTTMPSTSAAAAVRKRVAVPALPSISGRSGAARKPALGDDEARVVRLLDRDAHLPQGRGHQLGILDLSAPVRRLVPFASAASSSARLVIDLLPGGVTAADQRMVVVG